jgi:hypothetical protein
LRAPLALAVIAAAACGDGHGHETPAKTAPKARSETAQYLTQLSIVTRAARPSPAELADWSQRIEHGGATLGSYIDMLLSSPTFSKVVAPEILLGEVLVGEARQLSFWTYQLDSKPNGEGEAIYFLTAPCKASDAVRVHPWWAMKSEVLVCPAAYRPDVWTTKTSKGDEHTCNTLDGSPGVGETGCGCGPNLVRCVTGDDQAHLRVAAAQDELRGTVRYVVEHDLPISTVFSGRSTFHDRTMEFVYRHWRIEADHLTDGALLADLDQWPEDGKWAERFESAPGEHAGVLTAPGIVHYVGDRRQRQWQIFERLWCTGASSVGATPRSVLDLGVANFQAGKNEGWERMAKQPICTDCHARMDYGFQFFWAFPDPKVGAGHFVTSLARNGTRGMLYGNDIDDPRGEAELTPAGFASLALRQPEFGHCMSRDVVEHVFGADGTAADADAIGTSFDPEHTTVKQLTKAALLRWVAKVRAGDAPTTSYQAPAWSGAGNVPMSPELASVVGDECGSCHYDGAQVQSFDGKALPRPLLLKMLAEISAKRMPKDHPLTAARRSVLLDSLIAHLWRADPDRAEAHAALATSVRPPGVWRWSLSERLIRRAAGVPESTDRAWNALESAIRGDQATYTPGFATMTALEAIQACKDAGKKGPGFEACLRTATDPRVFLRDH